LWKYNSIESKSGYLRTGGAVFCMGIQSCPPSNTEPRLVGRLGLVARTLLNTHLRHIQIARYSLNSGRVGVCPHTLFFERNKMPQKLSRHHRKPVKNGGSDHPNNISLVSKTKHQAFHTLFGTMDPQGIADELNNTWIDPNYRLIVVRSTQ